MAKKIKPLFRHYSYRTLLVLLYKHGLSSGKVRWMSAIIDRDGMPWPGCMSEGAQHCNAITNRFIDKEWPDTPKGAKAIAVEITPVMMAALHAAKNDYLAREAQSALEASKKEAQK